MARPNESAHKEIYDAGMSVRRQVMVRGQQQCFRYPQKTNSKENAGRCLRRQSVEAGMDESIILAVDMYIEIAKW